MTMRTGSRPPRGPRDDLKDDLAQSEGEPLHEHDGALGPDEMPDDRDGGVRPVAEAWDFHLVRRESGPQGHKESRILATSPNVAALLRFHPAWAGVVALNEFHETVVTTQVPPWAPEDEYDAAKPGPWSTNDTTRFISWCTRVIGVDFKAQDVEKGLASMAESSRFHPVKEYLLTREWDGRSRIGRWLHTYLGATDNDYTEGVGARWLRSAVARVMRPGCQVDCTLILEGKPGAGKTRAFRSLVPEPEWYQDSGICIGEKDSYDALRGVWIYGLDELDSLRRGDATRVKNFLTSIRDHYRPPYDARTRDFLRQNVFCGTTNEEQYLLDRTGNRRFWPVRVADVIDTEALIRDRDQLWAEAFATFQAGMPWHVDTAALRLLCDDQQRERLQSDPWVALLGRWLAEPLVTGADGHPERLDVAGQGVLIADALIHGLKMRPGDVTTAHEMRAGACLREIGLERRRVHHTHGNAGREYRYFWPTPDPADVDR